MSYRDKASFGKRQEYLVVAELLRRGFDVYLTLVDDQGIDCIIRLDKDRYIDVQIKARSKEARQWNRFAALSIEPRENYYFIFYLEANDTIWVMPSNDVVALATKNQTGKNAGKYALNFPKAANTQKARQFRKYKGEAGFALLRDYQPAGHTERE